MKKINIFLAERKGNSLIVTLVLSLVVVGSALAYLYLKNQRINNPQAPLTPNAGSPDTSCQKNSDCSLQIQNSWSVCNLGENCQPIDYSQNLWIGVNNTWYQQTRTIHCPPDKYPGRGCDPKPVNDQYSAQCIQNTCQKKPFISQ